MTYEQIWKLQEQLNEAETRLYEQIRRGTPYKELEDLFAEVEELQQKIEEAEEE